MIIICTLILFGYLLELTAKYLRIPSVLLLIGLGVCLKVLTGYLGIATIDFMRVIPTLGTVGLILIVFEGGLEWSIRRRKSPSSGMLLFCRC